MLIFSVDGLKDVVKVSFFVVKLVVGTDDGDVGPDDTDDIVDWGPIVEVAIDSETDAGED